MTEKLIQFNIEELKMKFNNLYHFGINSIEHQIGNAKYALNENKWTSLVEALDEIQETNENQKKRIDDLRELLIRSGCVLD